MRKLDPVEGSPWGLAYKAIEKICDNIVTNLEYTRNDDSFIEEAMIDLELTEQEDAIYRKAYDQAVRDCIHTIELFKQGEL